MKRNAHACTTVAWFWLLFSFFTFLEWRDAQRHLGDPNTIFNFGIWGFQLLFIFFAIYFHRTETPREVLWFGDAQGFRSGVMRVDQVPSVLKQLALHFPEVTDTRIEEITGLAMQATMQEEASVTFATILRGRSEKFTVSFESWEGSVVILFIHTHLDLLDKVDEVLELYQDDIDDS